MGLDSHDDHAPGGRLSREFDDGRGVGSYCHCCRARHRAVLVELSEGLERRRRWLLIPRNCEYSAVLAGHAWPNGRDSVAAPPRKRTSGQPLVRSWTARLDLEF